MLRRWLLLCWIALMAAGSCLAGETFYVGTFTQPEGSRGIYRYELNEETGAVRSFGLAAELPNPSYLALHPNGKVLYCVNEITGTGCTVSALAIRPDGTLHPLNRESTLGSGPTHLSLDREAKNVLVANYNSGSAAVLPILPDGSVGKATGFMQEKGTGPNRDRQEGPHAHGIYEDLRLPVVYVTDLGVDRVYIYKFDAAHGTLGLGEPPFFALPPGAGPRHLALSPAGFIYALNELNNTVAVLTPSGGGLKEVQTLSTLTPDFTQPNTGAAIVLHPNGRVLYTSNRGHDSIARFTIGVDGRLTPGGHTPTGGKTPRFIGLNPSGKFLLAANQDTGNVVIFRVDEAGQLTNSGMEFKQAMPVCIVFVN